MSAGIAVLVNLRAGRTSEAVARVCERELEGARVTASRSIEEAQGFVRAIEESAPDLVVSAGGDGTAIALINALRGRPAASVPIGCMKLGTGNGWARVTGAPRWRRAIDQLRALPEGEVPSRRFDLVEVDGTLAHFAGTGWDAEMIDDFYAQKTGFGLIPQASRLGLSGYLQGMTLRTIPRHLFGRSERVEVELTNTGEDAIGVDDEGRPVPLPEGKHGAVLYRGPVSVCAAGTTPEWGFGFRAFPFAGLVPRRLCMRVYTGTVTQAVMSSGALWRGAHPMKHMRTWLLTRARAVFSREVPFQIGGDRVGWRSEVEYTLAEEQVDLLDWRRLPA
jgi:hypothetical protein